MQLFIYLFCLLKPFRQGSREILLLLTLFFAETIYVYVVNYWSSNKLSKLM